MYPIYWDDLTDEEKENGVDIILETSDTIPDSMTITVTPTDDWYAEDNETTGTPANVTATKDGGKIEGSINCNNGELPISPDFAVVMVNLTIQGK